MSDADRDAPAAVVFGCAGLELKAEEYDLYRTANPVGFILFARNIDTPDQVRRLTADLRAAVERPDALVMIDQEGGQGSKAAPTALVGLSCNADFWCAGGCRSGERR